MWSLFHEHGDVRLWLCQKRSRKRGTQHAYNGERYPTGEGECGRVQQRLVCWSSGKGDASAGAKPSTNPSCLAGCIKPMFVVAPSRKSEAIDAYAVGTERPLGGCRGVVCVRVWGRRAGQRAVEEATRASHARETTRHAFRRGPREARSEASYSWPHPSVKQVMTICATPSSRCFARPLADQRFVESLIRRCCQLA